MNATGVSYVSADVASNGGCPGGMWKMGCETHLAHISIAIRALYLGRSEIGTRGIPVERMRQADSGMSVRASGQLTGLVAPSWRTQSTLGPRTSRRDGSGACAALARVRYRARR